MAYVRGQERFVHQQVYDLVRQGLLVTLAWDGTELAGAFPWGASRSLTFIEQVPDPKLEPVVPNTIAFTEGRLPDETEEELGGSLVSSTHTFFVDIYGETASIAKVIAADVRSLLTGRAPGTSRYTTLKDYATAGTPVLAGHLLHFEDVEIEYPGVGGVGRLHWAVVKCSAVHEFNPLPES